MDATLDDRVRTAAAARRERQRAATRTAILDAATALFAAQGADAVSMREVGAVAGYTATTIYNYFEDKDDLLHHVVVEGFGAFGARLLAAAESTDDPAEQYVAIGLAYVGFALEAPFHYRLMFVEQPGILRSEPPDGSAPPIDSFEVLEQVIGRCVAAGELPAHVDPSVLAMETWTQVHGVATLAISSTFLDEEQALALQDRAGRTMLRGFRTEAAAGPAGDEPRPLALRRPRRPGTDRGTS